jgi:hypothetical protein
VIAIVRGRNFVAIAASSLRRCIRRHDLDRYVDETTCSHWQDAQPACRLKAFLFELSVAFEATTFVLERVGIPR